MANLAYRYEDERPTEMLDGVIYMMATPNTRHGNVGENISYIFKRYLKSKRCRVYTGSTSVFFTENDRVIPDVMVVCNRDIIKEKGVFGAPDIIVEILSPSTSKNDKGYKKSLYEKHGVKEYWIVNPCSFEIEVYWLADGKYQLNNVYTILPDYVKREMTEERIAEYPTTFKTSIFDDLVIDLDEVFEDV